jgi:hypothetical protein
MRTLLLLSIFCTGLACAQGAPSSADDKEQLRARAKSLHEQADAQRSEAETTFAAETRACWEKFLVTRCQDEAKTTKQDKLAVARRIEQEAREIDRDLRKREFAEREAKRAAEAPQRAADAAAQAEKNRQAQQEALERVERKRIEAEQREKH